jgi:predicted nucleotidyltransferase
MKKPSKNQQFLDKVKSLTIGTGAQKSGPNQVCGCHIVAAAAAIAYTLLSSAAKRSGADRRRKASESNEQSFAA